MHQALLGANIHSASMAIATAIVASSSINDPETWEGYETGGENPKAWEDMETGNILQWKNLLGMHLNWLRK